MLILIKQTFIALLSFGGSLPCVAKVSDRTKCISLNNDSSCLARSMLIDLYPN